MNAVKEGFLEEVEFKGTVGKGNSKVFQIKRENKTKQNKTGNKEGVYGHRADSCCRVETETIL